jgi:predicted AAA+ superfamily ATPase
MITRTLQSYLERDASYYPVLTVTGPRQSGKTTLVRETFPEYEYVSLEEIDMRFYARDDPRGFLQRYAGPVIIDEVQQVPDLSSYIQSSVDTDERPGRFVLTGSQNFLLMEKVSQSLAGRTGILHLLPFQRSELERQKGKAPSNRGTLFGNQHSSLDLWDTIFSGFYPRIHDSGVPPGVWFSDYIQTYVQRDVRSLVQVGDLERFERFLMLTAGRTGQILNYSSLANDAGVSLDTAKRWISVLKTSFIVFLLPPHHRNFNKRVIKSPKLYFYDAGLVCRLLGITSPDQAHDHPLRGALFENLVIAEAVKTYTHHRLKPPLSFWRDQSGHEIDLVIDAGADLYPVEIKSGRTVSDSMFAALSWWASQSGTPRESATLVHGGHESYTRNGIAVRPWFSI